MKKKRKEMTVLIEQLDYPDRSVGVELLENEQDPIDSLLELEEDYSSRPRGRKIVAKGGIPGQVWKAVKKRKRGDAVKVDLLELLKKSDLEMESKCPEYRDCGGCCYQTLGYETELMIKGRQIRGLFKDAGIDIPISIKPAPNHVGYRNKMEYSFGDMERGGDLTLGLHCPGHFYDIIPTPSCNIVHEDFNRIRGAVQNFFRKKAIPYYHKSTREGVLRHLVIRSTAMSGELMVNLVSRDDPVMNLKLLNEFVAMLKGLETENRLVSIIHTTNNSLSDAVIPDHVDLLWGRDHLEEILMSLSFHIGPFSFFQPNAMGAEKLYAKALDFAGDISGKTVYDLYSGTGTLTQLMAKRAKKAVGVEIVTEAVDQAKKTAEINGLDNVEFVNADVLKFLEERARDENPPELIMLDPPREGINPKALEKIVQTGVEKIVYISCNPRSQVRDIGLFMGMGYKVVAGQAFDQFPRTKHVEALTLLVRSFVE